MKLCQINWHQSSLFYIVETMKISLDIILLYGFTLAALIFSAVKDRKKTKKALKKGLKALNNILPQFITVLVIVSIVFSLFDKDLMIRIQRGIAGVLSGLCCSGPALRCISCSGGTDEKGGILPQHSNIHRSLVHNKNPHVSL